MQKESGGEQLHAQAQQCVTDEQPEIDLFKGWPDPALLPRDVIAETFATLSRSFSGGSVRGLPYGTPQIYTVELMKFLNRQCRVDEGYEHPARADSLMVNDGVSRGLDLICHMLSKPGDAVMIEAPTYKNARLIFQEYGLEVIPIATDAEGMLVDDAEAKLNARRQDSQLPPVRFIYTIPSNNNPTGSTLPVERRHALVKLARTNNVLILADEVYHLLHWRDLHERPPRMVCFDEGFTCHDGVEADTSPVVISISSFTKICAPGLRLGWFEAAPSILRKLSGAAYMTSGGNAALMAVIVAEALSTQAMDKAITAYCNAYRSRSQVVVDALEAGGLPPLVRPRGGFFVWVQLPVPAEAVLKKARSVKFMNGELCDSSEGGKRAARLCFAYNTESELRIGIQRFVQAVRDAQLQMTEQQNSRL